MGDAEAVLRFFALRHVEHYTRGMHGFLDLYMARANVFSREDLDHLRRLFLETIHLARSIYEDLVFCPYAAELGEWHPRAQLAFYDAVMVSLSSVLEHRDKLLQQREKIIQGTQRLFIENPSGTFTGRGNTKTDIQERIRKYSEMIQAVLR